MWFLIACGGAAVVCAASWLRAGRTRPLGQRPELTSAQQEAQTRASINRTFGSGFTGGGGV